MDVPRTKLSLVDEIGLGEPWQKRSLARKTVSTGRDGGLGGEQSYLSLGGFRKIVALRNRGLRRGLHLNVLELVQCALDGSLRIVVLDNNTSTSQLIPRIVRSDMHRRPVQLSQSRRGGSISPILNQH